MMLLDKRSAIDIVWQYSRFYGERLSNCERLFENEEGYAALILLFEMTESICKFVAGNYEDNFHLIVDKLYKKYTAEELNSCSKEMVIELFLSVQEQLDKSNHNIELLIEQMKIANQKRFGRSSEKLICGTSMRKLRQRRERERFL